MTTESAGTVSAVVEERGLIRARASAWWIYPGVALVSLVMVAVVMRLWGTDLHIPFTYHAEALFNGVLVKGVLEQGWHLSHPALGAPGDLDLRDVPMSDNNLHFALIRLLGLATSDYALVMNLFFVLTFPLTAVSALYVFRRFGLTAGPAMWGSLLYAFLPFHFARGQHHLFLSAYYLVPLAVMVALWIMAGDVAVVEGADRRGSRRPRAGKLMASASVAVLIASSGVYYAFFACFFWLVAGAVAGLRHRCPRSLVLPVALVAVTTAVLTAHFWPSILHLREHGDTPVVRRNPMETETYGLRISQLLLPPTSHRLETVARFKDAFNSQLPSNENDHAALGVIGGLGFLALLGYLVLSRRRGDGREGNASPVMLDLSILNLSAVLLATIGGFGTLVALILSPTIRAYNRISVYIAFFSLFAVVLGCDYVYRRHCRRWGRRAAFVVGLAVLLILGVLDQTSAPRLATYTTTAAEYRSDAAFVRQLEAAMPPGAMIFQLPVIPFPEHPAVQRMFDYDHARGYLHASHVRWSYGAAKGREGEVWQKLVAAQPVPRLLDTLVAAGFSGLYLNRDGYPDQGTVLGGEIARALGQEPLRSANGRLLFFDLRAYAETLRGQHSLDEWEARHEAALHPFLFVWQSGCSDLEGTPENNFRWCAAAGTWRLTNGARQTKRVIMEMTLSSHYDGTLWIKSPLVSEQMRIGPVRHVLSRTISVPPGRHTISFGCDARRVLGPGERRELVFRVTNFKAVLADP